MKLKIKVPSGRKVVSTEYGGFYGEFGEIIDVPDALGAHLLTTEPDAFELVGGTAWTGGEVEIDGVDTLAFPPSDAPAAEAAPLPDNITDDAARGFNAPSFRRNKEVGGNGD